MPFTRLLPQTFYEREPEKNKPETQSQKALAEVFRVVVQGGQPRPEESCHRCVRYYGIYTADRAIGAKDVNDHFADAGYASANVIGAAEDVNLMAEAGCVDQGTNRDAQEAVRKISSDKDDFDKDDVQDALDTFDELPVLEQIVQACKIGVVTR